MFRAFWFVLCLLLPGALAGGLSLPQRAYVWQRAWSDELRAGLAGQADAFAALDILAGEITWSAEGSPQWQPVAVDWNALAATRRPIAVVLRIGPRSGDWSADAEPSRRVVAVARDVLAEARRRGIEPVELQLDFDAATARLAAYRELLRTVKRELAPPRLVFTALPDWLRSADFPALAAEADAYVLQVHSLEKPQRFDDAYALCDPTKARSWVARASALGRPFRIALPTYGYRLVFDGAGKFVALEAEGLPQSWPEGHRTRIVTSDPAALAPFVEELLASPPRGCESLAWFRFPVANDELAWRWPTLRTVMHGQRPVAVPVLLAQPAANGAIDLLAGNTGTADAEPVAFRVTWREARLLATDPLAGWRIERAGARELIVRPPPHASNGLLRPADTRQVGWLRLDRPAEITTVALP